MKAFVQAHWKAIMPLVAGLLALAADHVVDLDLSASTKTAITSVLAAILVYLKANTSPAEPKAADKDAGEIGIIELIIVVTGILVLALSLGWLPR